MRKFSVLYKALRAAAKNPWQDAVRFESQVLNWTYEEVFKYQTAFSEGLNDLGVKSNDKILCWVDPKKQPAELFTLILAAAKLGAQVNTIYSVGTKEELQQKIGESNVVVVSPYLIFEPMNRQRIEAVTDVSSNQLVIHTGHKRFQKSIMFKEVPIYRKATLAESNLNNVLLNNNTQQQLIDQAEKLKQQSLGYNYATTFEENANLGFVAALSALLNNNTCTFAVQWENKQAAVVQKSYFDQNLTKFSIPKVVSENLQS